MREDYIAFLAATKSLNEGTGFDEKSGILSHVSHGGVFALSMNDGAGLFLRAMGDRALYEGVEGYLDPTFLPGGMAFEGEGVEKATVSHVCLRQVEEHFLLSSKIAQGGIECRMTAFTFEGGMVLMGAAMRSSRDNDDKTPIFQTTLARCFAHEEKMKVYKNTVTHGGMIFRNLIDENHLTKHIRPIAGENGEKRNVFTIAVQASPVIPCFAVEMTAVGMGFGAQIMANSESCQAIMLNEGKILSFAPGTGELAVF